MLYFIKGHGHHRSNRTQDIMFYAHAQCKLRACVIATQAIDLLSEQSCAYIIYSLHFRRFENEITHGCSRLVYDSLR